MPQTSSTRICLQWPKHSMAQASSSLLRSCQPLTPVHSMQQLMCTRHRCSVTSSRQQQGLVQSPSSQSNASSSTLMVSSNSSSSSQDSAQHMMRHRSLLHRCQVQLLSIDSHHRQHLQRSRISTVQAHHNSKKAVRHRSKLHLSIRCCRSHSRSVRQLTQLMPVMQHLLAPQSSIPVMLLLASASCAAAAEQACRAAGAAEAARASHVEATAGAGAGAEAGRPLWMVQGSRVTGASEQVQNASDLEGSISRSSSIGTAGTQLAVCLAWMPTTIHQGLTAACLSPPGMAGHTLLRHTASHPRGLAACAATAGIRCWHRRHHCLGSMIGPGMHHGTHHTSPAIRTTISRGTHWIGQHTLSRPLGSRAAARGHSSRSAVSSIST
jgi:hypothetical protein